jgi:hypothetical protein
VSERFKNRSPGGTYRDLVEALDWSAGEILATLERLGLDGVISFGQDMTGRLAGSQIGGTWTVDWYEIPDDRSYVCVKAQFTGTRQAQAGAALTSSART